MSAQLFHTVSAKLSPIANYLFPLKPGQSEDLPLQVKAVPGLTTLLDQALFRSNEGQLTATICSSHALLACWLDVKYQSQLVLHHLQQEEDTSLKLLCESFARHCLECSMDAIERLSTDKFAQSANLTDPYESTSSSVTGGHHNHAQVLSGVGPQGVAAGILESKDETGRRAPIQRHKDCWESPRLFCPDHVWADDSYAACQRWIRTLTKHAYVLRETNKSDALHLSSSAPSARHADGKDSKSAVGEDIPLNPTTERQASLLIQLIQDDVPMRLYQFRQAMEAEAVVTKRLYLVKSEYRAPFRAFLEAHQTLRRAPPMELVDSYLQNDPKNLPKTPTKVQAGLQKLLNTPDLVELLALERECEQLELDIGHALFPFTELARILDHKKARLKVLPDILEEEKLASLQETVRRLKAVLCRKGGFGTSTGIRPILLDLQQVPRDDELPHSPVLEYGAKEASAETDSTLEARISHFLSELQCLSTLVKTKNAFWTLKTSTNQSQYSSSQHFDIDLSVAILKGCTEEFDAELFQCQLQDWFAIVERQRELELTNTGLSDKIRQAEMAMSVAGASEQSLKMVKERLEQMQADRTQRLEVLQELVEEVCLREMNLFVRLNGPVPNQPLRLKATSAVGFLGVPLQMAGEPLPVG